MHSTLNPKQADPYDVFVVAPDVAPAGHADSGLHNSPHDSMRLPPDPQAHMGYDSSDGPSVPPVDTTFRAAAVGNIRVPGRRSPMGRGLMRGVIGFLLAVCLGVVGALWQSHGDVAQQMIAKWLPPFSATTSPTAAPAEQSEAPAVQAAAATTPSPQPASAAQIAPESVAPATAVSASESAQLQAMAQDLAAMGQQIDALKAAIAQLRANQEQTSRDVARVSEQNARPRVSAPAPAPRPVAAPARRPPQPFRPTQGAVTPIQQQAAAPPPLVQRQPEPLPLAPAQPQVESRVSSALRPPMPVP
jgi:predicted outer membrane lipoprotein